MVRVRIPGDNNIIFLKDLPSNLKLFAVINNGGVPYITVAGTFVTDNIDNNDVYFENSYKSAPLDWGRDLDNRDFDGLETVPFQISARTADSWSEMLDCSNGSHAEVFTKKDNRRIEKFSKIGHEYLDAIANKTTRNLDYGYCQLYSIARMRYGAEYSYSRDDETQMLVRKIIKGDISVDEAFDEMKHL